MFSRKKTDTGVQEGVNSKNNDDTGIASSSQTIVKQTLPHDKTTGRNSTLKQNSDNLNCQDSVDESNVSHNHTKKNLTNDPSKIRDGLGKVDGNYSKDKLDTQISACDNEKADFPEKFDSITQNVNCEKSNLSLQPTLNMNGCTKNLCSVDKENVRELESKSTDSARCPSEGGLEESDLVGSDEPLQPTIEKPDYRRSPKPEFLQSNKKSQNSEFSKCVGEKVENRTNMSEITGNTFFSVLKEKIRSSKMVEKKESCDNRNQPQIQNSTRKPNLHFNSEMGQNLYSQQTDGKKSCTSKSIDERPLNEQNLIQQNEVPIAGDNAQSETLSTEKSDGGVYSNRTNNQVSTENYNFMNGQEIENESRSVEKENDMRMKRSVCDPISESSYVKSTSFQSNKGMTYDNQSPRIETDVTFEHHKTNIDECKVVTPKDDLKAKFHNLSKGKEKPLKNVFKNASFGEKASQYSNVVTPGSTVSVKKKINDHSNQTCDDEFQTYDSINISERMKTINKQPKSPKLNNEASKFEEQGSNPKSKVQVEKEFNIESQVDRKKEESHSEASIQILHEEKNKQSTRLSLDLSKTDKFPVPNPRMVSPALKQNLLNDSSVSMAKGDIPKNNFSVTKQKELSNETPESTSNLTSKRLKTATGKSQYATDKQPLQVIPFGPNKADSDNSKYSDQSITVNSSRQGFDQLESFSTGNMSLAQSKKSVGLNYSNECFDDILSAFQTDLRESVDLLDQGEVDLLDLHVDVSKVHAMALRYHGKMVDLVEDVENVLNYAYENMNEN